MGFLYRYPEAGLGDLIAEAQNLGSSDNQAINEIVRRFEGLTRKIGRQLANGQSYREDVENAARFGLTQAVCNHQGLTRTFPSYARIHMAGSARRELAAWVGRGDHSLVQLNEALASEVTAVPVEDLADHADWGFGDTADAIATLLPTQQSLLTSRYVHDAALSTIADAVGTTVSAVSQRLSTIHRRLSLVLAA